MAYLRNCDFVVVGAGVMGAATARALARSGRDVVLLEQFAPGHTRGSSHGRSRIFRLSYPEAGYVEMAQKAQLLWRDLEEESRERLLSTTGGFDLGERLEAHAAALESCGATHELMAGRDAAQRFPHMTFSPREDVLFQPDAGVISAELAVTAFTRSAVGHGAELRTSERVVSLEPGSDDVQVHSEHAIFRAQAVIVTAGAWAAPLLATAGIDLPVRVTRETVGFFEVHGDVPPPVVQWADPSIYALPSPGQGLKAAQHIAGPEIDPDSGPVPDAISMEVVGAWVQERFPNADSSPHHVETCLYTNTADERFVLERHGSVIVGSPCSGHGFKFAPLIGRRLANLAEGVEAD